MTISHLQRITIDSLLTIVKLCSILCTVRYLLGLASRLFRDVASFPKSCIWMKLWLMHPSCSSRSEGQQKNQLLNQSIALILSILISFPFYCCQYKERKKKNHQKKKKKKIKANANMFQLGNLQIAADRINATVLINSDRINQPDLTPTPNFTHNCYPRLRPELRTKSQLSISYLKKTVFILNFMWATTMLTISETCRDC